MKTPRPPGCRRCIDDYGQNWVPFVVVTVNGVQSAQRCSCARGRHLAMLDAQHHPRSAREPVADAAVVDLKRRSAGDRTT